MKDYRLTVRVKNNYLLTLMEEAGFATVSALARASGVDNTTLGRIANLKAPAFSIKSGDWLPSLKRVAEVLNCSPGDLMPPQHWKATLPVNAATVEMSVDDVRLLMPEFQAQIPAPDFAMEQADMTKAIGTALEELNPRERAILTNRFGLDGEQPMTLQDLSERFGVGRERIRQIEQRALRKLRHPARTRLLRPAWNGEE